VPAQEAGTVPGAAPGHHQPGRGHGAGGPGAGDQTRCGGVPTDGAAGCGCCWRGQILAPEAV
jgi:hypothetical protein